jgi:hypothetical protein
LQYSAVFPQLKAGDSAYVQFRLKFNQNQYIPTTATEEETRARGPYTVTGILTGVHTTTNLPVLTNCGQNLDDDQLPPVASAEVARTLNCTAQGTTETAC